MCGGSRADGLLRLALRQRRHRLGHGRQRLRRRGDGCRDCGDFGLSRRGLHLPLQQLLRLRQCLRSWRLGASSSGIFWGAALAVLGTWLRLSRRPRPRVLVPALVATGARSLPDPVPTRLVLHVPAFADPLPLQVSRCAVLKGGKDSAVCTPNKGLPVVGHLGLHTARGAQGIEEFLLHGDLGGRNAFPAQHKLHVQPAILGRHKLLAKQAVCAQIPIR
mmetsp:Transcript_78311/g.173531  ORF Transcript_78311/g.173531 Transcript_78311/m.173531 type:complete len:219 (+) Transcript_78311:50-706(+)